MKFISEGVAYLQKVDVAFLLGHVPHIPLGVVRECEEEYGSLVVVEEARKDEADFECIFRKPVSVRWIRDQRWLVDWNDVRDKTVDELKFMIHAAQDREAKKINLFTSRNEKYYEENLSDFRWSHKKVMHQLCQLEAAYAYIAGDMYFKLPKGAGKATNMSPVAHVKQFFKRISP